MKGNFSVFDTMLLKYKHKEKVEYICCVCPEPRKFSTKSGCSAKIHEEIEILLK